MKTAVILPAAGVGRRFNGGDDAGPSKVEMTLAGKAVFVRAIELFLRRPEVSDVLLAVHPEKLEAFALRWGDTLRFLGVRLVAGGTVERWETVAKALAEVPAHCTHVAVHDAARPMTSDALIERVFAAAATHDAVIPALPVTSTLKRVKELDTASEPPADPLDAILGDAGKAGGDPGGDPGAEVRQVVETVPRAGLVAVETPQVFAVGLLRRAYAQVSEGRFDAAGVTDDASLVEALGEPVYVVEGETENLKLTRAADVALCEAILAKRAGDASQSRKRLFGDDDEDE
ncbi:MAG: 2-C-methyl-D-erythritol 4-phosphate cytidylyltransferase [Phycisphaeraceae bacterium]